MYCLHYFLYFVVYGTVSARARISLGRLIEDSALLLGSLTSSSCPRCTVLVPPCRVPAARTYRSLHLGTETVDSCNTAEVRCAGGRRSGVITRDVSGGAGASSRRARGAPVVRRTPASRVSGARVRACSAVQTVRMSEGEGSVRWPAAAGILRRSGARAARRVLRVKYRSVPPSPAPAHADDTVSCFCRKARRKERDGDAAAGSDPKLYLQEALLERKLPELDMRALVELPRGLDYNEWLASHTLALFDHVNLVYGTVSEFCTAASCPEMAGPGGRAYAWLDERGKKSRVAAPQYVDYVMTYTQNTVNDETLFPTKYANEFPAAFEATVRRVARLLFHVVAHMYAAHFRELALLRLHAHLHLTFAHLTALDARFHLLDHKETEVLRDLEVALRLTEAAPCGEAAPEEPSPRRRSPVVTQPLATA